jgi:hypothetical protein
VRAAGLAPCALVLGLLGLGCAEWRAGGDREDASFEAIVARVERVRGIRAARPIDVRVVGPDEIGGVVKRVVAPERDADTLARYEAALVTVGLWPSDRSLVDEYVEVMGEEVAGLYVPEDRALYVVSDAPAPSSDWLASALARRDRMAEFALTHELVHLLQHQLHPELFEDDELYRSQDDAAIAAQSAFEGDATYTAILAMGASVPPPDELDVGMAESGEALRDAPALIRELIGFPYAEGYRLAARERAELLEEPPASTEQVLHPERRRAPFWSFDLAELAASLPPGCELVFENTVGELQLSILMRDLSDPGVDPSVWDGWDGDRYLAARCAAGRELLWLTSFDSGQDAAEFAAAYLEVAPSVALRAGLGSPLRVHRVGREVIVASQALAPLEADLERRARRARIETLAELREWAPRR